MLELSSAAPSISWLTFFMSGDVFVQISKLRLQGDFYRVKTTFICLNFLSRYNTRVLFAAFFYLPSGLRTDCLTLGVRHGWCSGLLYFHIQPCINISLHWLSGCYVNKIMKTKTKTKVIFKSHVN